MNSIKIKIGLFLINNIFSGTRFFYIKYIIMKIIGINIGKNTSIVGPIYFNSAVSLEIGENCWIGKNFTIDGNGEVIIGKNVDIAPHVVINTGGHLIGKKNRRAGSGICGNVEIEDGCWICTRVTIINSVKISKGCVVAAGALVNKSLDYDLLVGGVPAVTIRRLD